MPRTIWTRPAGSSVTCFSRCGSNRRALRTSSFLCDVDVHIQTMPNRQSSIVNRQSSVITRIETMMHPDYPKLLWVRLHTNDGLVGLAETSFGPEAVAAWIHESAAETLLGADPMRLDYLWQMLGRAGTFTSRARGTEVRGQSALDIA